MEEMLKKVYQEQKDEEVKNRGSFSSPKSPSSVSWRAVTCVEPRDRFESVPATELGRGGMSQKTQFMDLAAAGPGRGGTIACSCVSTHPKPTPARNVICKEGTANSLSPPPASPRFCYHGNAHTQALIFSFLLPSRKTCCTLLPPSHSNSTSSQ